MNRCVRQPCVACAAQGLTPDHSPQTPVAAVLAREAKKRKTDDPDGASSKKSKRPPKPAAAQRNTAIYVSHLPRSATTAQLAAVFGKAGLILEDAEGAPRIKMYEDDQGQFKGEALVVYLKPESVDLAVTLMDETELVLGSGDGLMTVKKATWEKKAEGAESKDVPKDSAPAGKKGGDAQKQKTARRAEKLLAYGPDLTMVPSMVRLAANIDRKSVV